MKILQINSVCGIRSTGRICTDIATVLQEAGHECRIAYGRETVPEQHKAISYRIGSGTSVKVDGVISRLFDNTGFNSVLATKRFIKWMKQYDPDIIHLHNIHGYYINIKLLFEALKEMDKPVVWTLHDCWPFTGHCSHFDRKGCKKWQTGCHNCPQKKNYPASLLLDRSAKNYEMKKQLFTGLRELTVVTPSKWLAELVKQSFLGKYPVQVIHNGIALENFKPTDGDFRTQYGLEDKKIVLAVSSVWGKNKGYEDVCRLPELLPASYQVVVVGISPEQKAALPEHIIGITRTNNVQQLAEIYTAADVFVNPTYQDNYPTVNLEAQACGTPVITYRTGGSAESVPDDQVVKQGDLEGLCAMIQNCEKLQLKQQDFSAAYAFNQYLELYNAKK